MPKTVAISYGIFEGRWHGTRLRRELTQAGYQVITDITTADIIIGHSAGCYFLPERRTQQSIMLIDPPYWPGRSIARRIAAKLAIDLRYGLHRGNFFYTTTKNFWNLFYAITEFSRSWTVIQARHYDVEAIIKTHQVILIRNHDDAWLTPDLSKLQQDDPAIIVRDLPGEHDDCWRHPEPYVAVLNSL